MRTIPMNEAHASIARALTHHRIEFQTPDTERKGWLIKSPGMGLIVLKTPAAQAYAFGLADKERQFRSILEDPSSIIPNDLLDPDRLAAS